MSCSSVITLVLWMVWILNFVLIARVWMILPRVPPRSRTARRRSRVVRAYKRGIYDDGTATDASAREALNRAEDDNERVAESIRVLGVRASVSLFQAGVAEAARR